MCSQYVTRHAASVPGVRALAPHTPHYLIAVVAEVSRLDVPVDVGMITRKLGIACPPSTGSRARRPAVGITGMGCVIMTMTSVCVHWPCPRWYGTEQRFVWRLSRTEGRDPGKGEGQEMCRPHCAL